jgi:LacI family transcriptional regulator
MRVTMVQVAREAGVDKATVSRALKGDPRISLATRERVWEAVKRLGYEPDAVAKGLSSSKSEMVAVVFRSLAPDWTGCFLSGVERVLAKGRMDFMVRSTGDLAGARESLFRMLSARRVDGLIWLDPEMPRLPSIPTVTVGFRCEGAVSVLIDEEEGERRLRSLVGDAPVCYWPGEGALFAGIGRKVGCPCEGEVPPQGWVFRDGTLPGPGEKAILASGQGREGNPFGLPLFVWPAFETGVLSARLLLNSIRQQANLPDVVLVQPRLDVEEPFAG